VPLAAVKCVAGSPRRAPQYPARGSLAGALMALIHPMPETGGQFSDKFDLDGYPSSHLCEKAKWSRGELNP
jgi:hypothetical protein